MIKMIQDIFWGAKESTKDFDIKNSREIPNFEGKARMLEAEKRHQDVDIKSCLYDTFIGRAKELSYLQNLLKRSLKGTGSFVVISGEAGTGKSTLVKQFASKAVAQDFTYITESFRQIKSYEPYRPFLQIISKLGGSKLKELSQVGASSKTSKKESTNTFSTWDMQALYALQTEKKLAQQILVSTLIKASHKKPLLIALNDVHFAPLTAWQFIHYLTHSIVDHRIVMLITLRQDGKVFKKENMPVYADVLQRMNREQLIEQLRLKRFQEKEVKEFVRQVFKRTDFSSKFVPILYEVSGGLPREIVRILEILIDKNIIYQQDQVWFNQENLVKEDLLHLSKTESNFDNIHKLLKELTIDQKTLLDYSALMDGHLNHRVIASVLDMSPIKVLKHLEDLTAKKILVSLPDGGYRFKQPPVQTFLSEQIREDSKAALHLEIAQAIQKMDDLDKDQKVYLLAYHYLHSPDKISAFKYLHAAGDRALHHLAFLEAIDFYKPALDLINDNPEISEDPQTVEMLVELAWLERVLGDWADSLRCCKMARRLCHCKNDPVLDSQIQIQEGFTYFRRNDWDRAKKRFHDFLSHTNGKTDFNKAIAHYGLASIHFELSDYTAAQEHLEIALALAESLDATALLANILNNLGALENVRGNSLQSIGFYSRSIPLFKKLGNRAGLALIYHNIGMTHAEQGNWEQANQFYGKCLALADEMGIMPQKSITFLNRALALAYLGRFDEAREYNFKAKRLLERLQDELGLAEYYKIQGIIESLQRNWKKAERNLNIALEKYAKKQNELGIAETELEWARLAQNLNDEEKRNYWIAKTLHHYNTLGLNSKVRKIKKEFNINDELMPSAANE